MNSMRAVLVLVRCVIGTGAVTCPSPESIQSDYVKQNFDVLKFQGVWYEVAYHDITQPIGLCKCERSVKLYHPETNYIFDNFTLECFGKTYFNNLTFNLTGFGKGHMEGNWPLLHSVKFPNTVVAVNVKDGEYEWVIEFQCVELAGETVFTGINFYNRNQFVSQSELQQMLDTARQQGLGYWMDSGLKVHIVDQTNCTFPASPSKRKKTAKLYSFPKPAGL